MEDILHAYFTGWLDGMAGHRDPARAADHRTGCDYRIGFLDARIEIFRLLAAVRQILEEADDGLR
jgi:hypothetical protein